ncbi:hypothetical protein [Nostoc sp.]|uniref:hypothetical protein n=1 Tax=Nostoc sp. TaxID=1180 RepID=UPI002FF6C805
MGNGLVPQSGSQKSKGASALGSQRRGRVSRLEATGVRLCRLVRVASLTGEATGVQKSKVLYIKTFTCLKW